MLTDARAQQQQQKVKLAAKQQPKKSIVELSKTARNKLLRELRQHRVAQQQQQQRAVCARGAEATVAKGASRMADQERTERDAAAAAERCAYSLRSRRR